MADEMVNINVVIADRPYRLKINQEEEDKVRDIGVEAMKNKSVDGSQVMEEMENVSNRLDQLDELLDLALSR